MKYFKFFNVADDIDDADEMIEFENSFYENSNKKSFWKKLKGIKVSFNIFYDILIGVLLVGFFLAFIFHLVVVKFYRG